MAGVRPTIRVLREDLKLPLPSSDVPLDEIDHPLLKKANEAFREPGGARERIRAVDDALLFKVKVNRWRGAVWTGVDSAWLVAAGVREDGSTDDFYAALAMAARARRAERNRASPGSCRADTSVSELLPGPADQKRFRLEEGVRYRRVIGEKVRALTRASLRDGREHSADLSTFVVGIQVRDDDSLATYVAVRITGSAPEEIISVLLARVPGCALDMWALESCMPDRGVIGAEQVWSTLMDPGAAASLLTGDY